MILVFGRTGQVARELQRLAPEARFLGREAADLSDPGACARAIREAADRGALGAVINAAAYTAVDRAEEELKVLRRAAAAPTEKKVLSLAKLAKAKLHQEQGAAKENAANQVL